MPPMMQASCPGLSLVMRAGFTVMTLRQSNNAPTGKVPTDQDQEDETGEEQSQEHVHNFL
jgi:hypothetical protein